ncbi:uncharacterized protein LOC124257972 [Haliotis rubra]|uniref:uncharacterized protein LOC124257972 n=1 Tax=Haliotis rubra TaxID=36100 RepID=UPI001EE58974|nr:uncharacterized protein LOC124257972 [Haliotis rubra]
MPSLQLAPDVSSHFPDMETIPTPSTRLLNIVNGTHCGEYYDFETGPRDMALFLCAFLLCVMIFVGLLWSLRKCVRRLRCPYSPRESALDAAERGESDFLAPHEDYTLAPNTSWWEVVVKREAEDPTFGRDLVVAPEYLMEDEVLRYDPDYCLKSGALWWEVVEAQERAGS